MATDSKDSVRSLRLSQTLGIVAGLLAWTAALIHYLKHGEVRFALIAAGLFIMAIGFMSVSTRSAPSSHV